jgi:DHA1 family inner membrane transport protein
MAGFAVAGVVGVPLGVWFGGLFGWRAAMLASAAAVLGTLAWVWLTIPGRLPHSAMDLSAIGRVLKNPVARITFAMTLAMSVGQMTVFTYFAPLLRHAVGAGTGTVAMLMSVLGMSSIAGSAAGVRFMDRLRPPRMIRMAAVMVAGGMLLWPLAQGSVALCALIVMLWGAGSMIMFSSLTTQILLAGQEVANVSMALNTSMNFLGSMAGASVGGLLLSLFGLDALPWGCILVYIGIACAVPLLTRQPARA